MKLFSTKKSLIVVVIFLISGCTTNDDIELRTAQFDFSFRMGTAVKSFITSFQNDTIAWQIDAAMISVGEIGIHWKNTRDTEKYNIEEFMPMYVTHDIPGGKISPKIYAYYAINLLGSLTLQSLMVEPRIYDHVHMIMKPSNIDSTIDAKKLPELLGHSYYFAGIVSHEKDTLPFKLYCDSIFMENDLGDVVFDLRVFDKDKYDLYLFPKFDVWFNDIRWTDLVSNSGDTIIVNDINENSDASAKFKNRFTFDNAFGFVAELHE